MNPVCDCRSACQIKKIIWDDDTTSLFNHICSQEITQGNMEVGKLSVEILCEKLAKEGIQCTNYQIQNKWDDLKRLHSFWHNQVLGSKVKIKDEKFWKRVLKVILSSFILFNSFNGSSKVDFFICFSVSGIKD